MLVMPIFGMPTAKGRNASENLWHGSVTYKICLTVQVFSFGVIPIPISIGFWASPVGDAQNAGRFDFAQIIFGLGEKWGIVNHEFRLSVDAR